MSLYNLFETWQILVEAQMDLLRQKHELEKQNAKQEFESYKMKAIGEALRIQSDYQIKFDSQEQSISKMNAHFLEKMLSFRSCNNELSESLESLQTNNIVGLDETRLSFANEMSELKRANAEESKNVIKEQLQAQGVSQTLLSY